MKTKEMMVQEKELFQFSSDVDPPPLLVSPVARGPTTVHRSLGNPAIAAGESQEEETLIVDMEIMFQETGLSDVGGESGGKDGGKKGRKSGGKKRGKKGRKASEVDVSLSAPEKETARYIKYIFALIVVILLVTLGAIIAVSMLDYLKFSSLVTSTTDINAFKNALDASKMISDLTIARLSNVLQLVLGILVGLMIGLITKLLSK
jgi:hypothetical protein